MKISSVHQQVFSRHLCSRYRYWEKVVDLKKSSTLASNCRSDSRLGRCVPSEEDHEYCLVTSSIPLRTNQELLLGKEGQQETWVVGVKERGAKSKTGGEERLKRPCVSSWELFFLTSCVSISVVGFVSHMLLDQDTICHLLKAVNSKVLMSRFVCHSSSLNTKNHCCWTTRKTCARFSFVNFSLFSLFFGVFVF